MDPLTALAAIKTGVAAGKQLHNLSKEISGFFDATDGAKKAHAKKKNGVFASANEEALATWTQAQNAKTAEAELQRVYRQQQRLLCLSGTAEDTP